MQAITTWLLVTADIRDVARAQAWLVGSLDGRSWDEVDVALWGTLVLLVVVAAAAFQFKPMHLGDDVAAGLGVRYTRVRAVLLLCAVLLAGVAVSAAGPVPFVALVAPQVAMRLARCPTPPMVASGLVGALLLIGVGPDRADGAADHPPGRRGHRRRSAAPSSSTCWCGPTSASRRS